MTLDAVLFLVLAVWIGLSAASVPAAKSLLHAAMGLMFALIGVGFLDFLLGAEFLGAVQLMVYVGGTMVLVVFGGMMTTKGATSEALKPVGLIVGASAALALFLFLVQMSLRGAERTEPQPLPNTTSLGLSFLGVGSPSYLLPFELISVHLLVVLVGAAYLARAKRRAA